MIRKIILAIFITVTPFFVFANGGDQRVVDGKYIINLARSPFTPHAGEKVTMLVSFVDIKTNKLIVDDLILKIRIAKWGGDEKRTFIHEQGNLKVSGGVIQIPYTFTTAGIHEIFFDFALTSNLSQIYKAPDFLLDVQPKISEGKSNYLWVLAVLAVALCLGMGVLMKKL